MKTIIQNTLLYPEILWERPVHYYKSKAGKVLILAGSKGNTQTAVLTSEAVFRSGTGILTLGFPDRVKEFFKDFLPEAMTLALPSTLSDSLSKRGHDEILEQSRSCDVALIGPGLSTNAETVQLIWDLLFEIEIPIVLSLDGIGALVTGIEVLRKKESIEFMTNFMRKIKKCLILILNVAETHRLLKAINHEAYEPKKFTNQYIERNLSETGQFINQFLGCITVIEGKDIVAVGDQQAVLCKGVNIVVPAESGEILSGIVSSFVAQNPQKMFEATVTALYLYGLAGKLARGSDSAAHTSASDVIRFLPEAIKQSEGL